MIEDELHAYYEKYKYLVEAQKHHRNFTLDNIDDFAKGIHSKVSKLKMVQNKIKREHEREAEAIAKSDYLLEQKRRRTLQKFTKWKEYRQNFEEKREVLVKMLKNQMIVKRWISLLELCQFLTRL